MTVLNKYLNENLSKSALLCVLNSGSYLNSYNNYLFLITPLVKLDKKDFKNYTLKGINTLLIFFN